MAREKCGKMENRDGHISIQDREPRGCERVREHAGLGPSNGTANADGTALRACESKVPAYRGVKSRARVRHDHEARITKHASRSTHHETRVTRHASRSTHHEARITRHASRGTRHEARVTRHASRSTHHEAASRRTHHTKRHTPKTQRRRWLTGQATPPCSPHECPAASAAKNPSFRSPAPSLRSPPLSQPGPCLRSPSTSSREAAMPRDPSTSLRICGSRCLSRTALPHLSRSRNPRDPSTSLRTHGPRCSREPRSLVLRTVAKPHAPRDSPNRPSELNRRQNRISRLRLSPRPEPLVKSREAPFP
jgi:hypothetical protein